MGMAYHVCELCQSTSEILFEGSQNLRSNLEYLAIWSNTPSLKVIVMWNVELGQRTSEWAPRMN